MARVEATGKKVASTATKVLRSNSGTKAERSVPPSKLTQSGNTEQTNAKAASAASKIMASKSTSKVPKPAAALGLTQKSNSDQFVLGREAFASISAIEGVFLTSAIKADLRRLDGATPVERRLVLLAKYGKK